MPLDYLQTLKPLAMRFGLERMERALDALGHPERRFAALHVAGTNGKGSTCAFAAAALRAAGHEVGLYTSPHLERVNERIAVNGEPISDAALDGLVAELRRALPWHDAAQDTARRAQAQPDEAGPERAGGPGGPHPPGANDALTYFEFTTLAGFLHFARAGVGVAVVEVGLGGRLDATNVLAPAACAIASIGHDHQELLGPTLADVAREKAGILKAGVPCAVAAGQPPEALEAIREVARRVGAPLVEAAPAYEGRVALPGPHQRQNAALAAAASRLLDGRGVRCGEEAIARGIASARWPGRLEKVGGGGGGACEVWLDGAHNPEGARALARAIETLWPGRPVHLVFGVLRDKDLEPMLAELGPRVASAHLVAPPTPRALPPSEFLDRARRHFPRTEAHPSVAEGIAAARRLAGPGGVALVAGSLYLVGEARRLLRG